MKNSQQQHSTAITKVFMVPTPVGPLELQRPSGQKIKKKLKNDTNPTKKHAKHAKQLFLRYLGGNIKNQFTAMTKDDSPEEAEKKEIHSKWYHHIFKSSFTPTFS